MLRPALTILAILWLACGLLAGGVLALTRWGGPPERVAALLPDESCPAPCWQGLRPGWVEQEQVPAWLAGLPDSWQVEPLETEATLPRPSNMYDVTVPGGAFRLSLSRLHDPATEIIAVLPRDLVLGDLLAALGAPDYVAFRIGDSLDVLATLYYEEAHMWAECRIEDVAYAIRPATPVYALVYDAVPWSRPALAFDWLGLGSLDRYYPAEAWP
jgi:hypothetical protein